MDNLTGSMKDVTFATSPREFDLPYSTTLAVQQRNGATPESDDPHYNRSWYDAVFGEKRFAGYRPASERGRNFCQPSGEPNGTYARCCAVLHD